MKTQYIQHTDIKWNKMALLQTYKVVTGNTLGSSL